MKTKITILIGLGIAVVAGGVTVSRLSPFAGKVLTPVEIQEKWGSQPFDSKKFSSEDLKMRASMAHSIVASKENYMGKTGDEIREIFGYADGHYVNERFPSYVLEIGSKKSPETWQLVFMVDRDLKVNDVIVLSRRRK